MGTPLNRLAPGLLDFFGIKAGGWGPVELARTLVPHMDLTRWYLDPAALEVAPVIAAFAVNTNQGPVAMTSTSPVDLVVAGVITVPQTEVWLVLEATMSWNFSAAAGQVADFNWSFAIPNNGTHFAPAQLGGNTTSVAAITQGGSRTMLNPYWAPPGTVIQPSQYGIQVGAANITVGGRLRVARLRA